MKTWYKIMIGCLGILLFGQTLQAQFVHPGISHVKSDLDRMKNMVEAGKDPWSTTYNILKVNSDASYNYSVRGSESNTTITNHSEFINDGFAAYHNALMWYITGDERHAQKCVEIFNAWVNITRIEDQFALNNGRGPWKMLEGAEIIKHTYDGWAEADIQKFKDMLVYPGWSGTTAPTAAMSSKDVSFYWNIYQGDPARHGNQGLFAYRSLMAMGIFLDNEVMYQRALRYLQGLPHLEDDLPYPSGPPVTVPRTTGNEYYDEFSQTSRSNAIEDYGYNEVLRHYIWENGQCQESSRDQAHALGGVSIITNICEMAWSQGDDLFGHLDNRALLGLEFYYRYNLSYDNTYPDQLIPWEPTVESGEFIQRLDRSGRWKSLKMNPYTGANLEPENWNRGLHNLAPVYELSLGHYKDRLLLPDSATKWTERGFEYLTEKIGVEDGRHAVDHAGWGGLKFRRVSPGDPIKGFTDSIPNFAMNVLPDTIEAENFDYFPIQGDKITYHDVDTINTPGKYRMDAGIDIDTCSEGGYQVSSLEEGEWLSYTIHVPNTALYNISIRYASANANGKIKFSFDGEDKTDEVVVPFGDTNSNGLSDYKDFTVVTDAILSGGVQQMKISICGDSDSFILDKISFEIGTETTCTESLPSISPSSRKEPGINYMYYEGSWDSLPDFDALTPLEEGLTDSIKLIDGIVTDSFALVFEGYIDIPILGSYTFYTISGEGSRLLIDGIEIVDNDGLHDAVEKSGSICLDEGFHDIRLEYFEKNGNEELEVLFEGPGTSKRSISGLYGIGACTNLGVTPPDNLVEGLEYKEYHGDWQRIPNFDLLIPVDSNIISTISADLASADDYYGLTFSGYILIEESGDYTFYTASDDGSRLLIDDMEVVSNDGTHGTEERSGNLCLEAGYHKIRIEYFENSGGQSLSANIMGGGISKSLITNQQLFTEPFPKDDQLITFESLDTVIYGEVIAFSPVVSSSSGLDVKLSSSNTAVATVAYDNKIWIRGIGTTIITASQAGNTFYNVATDVQQTLVVTEVSSLQKADLNKIPLLYPNPVTDILNIKRTNTDIAKAEIFNSVGTSVMSISIKGAETKVDVSKLATGMYHIRITNDGYTVTNMFMKNQ